MDHVTKIEKGSLNKGLSESILMPVLIICMILTYPLLINYE